MRRSPDSATKNTTLAYCTEIFVVAAEIFQRRDAEGAEVFGGNSQSGNGAGFVVWVGVLRLCCAIRFALGAASLRMTD
jgi:hypothetical protein